MLGQLGHVVLLLAFIEAYRGQRAEPILGPGFLKVAHGGGGVDFGQGVSWSSVGNCLVRIVLNAWCPPLSRSIEVREI